MKPSIQRSRRRFIKNALSASTSLALLKLAPAWASPIGVINGQTVPTDTIDLTVQRLSMPIANMPAMPVTINGTTPGPLIRLREGHHARINVTNLLNEDTSIHWHGFILPSHMDGVPGISFAGIKPNTTFQYQFDVQQNGSYWYHSHSGFQEQTGHIGPIIIDPKDGDIGADREHVILLSDWTIEDPQSVFRHLKVSEGYYNYQQRTLSDTIADIKSQGLAATWQQRSMWEQMRMSSRDIADVTASTYTYLMNGLDANSNWSGLYKPGEEIRLRVINGSAMSYFDFRIPGLEMTVIAADGQPIKPVTVDEFRIATAEAFDVLIKPKGNQTYTLFAESMDRSGYVRGTLTTELGREGDVPALRPPSERGMSAMGMSHDMAGMDHNQMTPDVSMDMSDHHMGHAEMMHHESESLMPSLPVDSIPISHDNHDRVGVAMISENPTSRLNEPGVGLENVSHRVLVYQDLIGAHPWPDERPPERTLQLHLTGNMERYMWSFDGKKFTEVDGIIPFNYGERLRLVLVNDTMMDHPIHLHGMWMELENGHYPRPRKHTISVKPSEKVSLLISADAKGDWAFHCHLLYHMKAGMFRVVSVA